VTIPVKDQIDWLADDALRHRKEDTARALAAAAEGETYCLAYQHKPTGQWHFIPTVPVARKWRGGFPNEGVMRAHAVAELGDAVTIIITKVPPSHLSGADPSRERNARIREAARDA